jgi:crotonobetainyl-CoA:carnitine CoA-transferase CaiB-like acyl-CoA transferase
VVAENFRPGTLDRLGLGYEAVRERKPDIIYASASGFGASGPYAKRPGQDLLIQAMSGLAAIGGADGRPVPVGCAAVDQHGAALLALAISGAYCKLLTTGQGTRIESTLLNAAIDLQTESIVTYYASGVGRDRIKRDPHLGSWFHDAPYGVYRIKDGHIALSLNQVGVVGAALESPDILAFSDRNAYEERDAIAKAVAKAVGERDFADLSQAFDAKGVWYARVEDYDDLIHNPQVKVNGGLESVDVNGADVTLVSHPVTYDGRRPGFRSFALQPGADTRSILQDAGFAPSELADLLRDGIVFAPIEASA